MRRGILRMHVRYNERSSDESRRGGEVIQQPPAINQSSSTLLRRNSTYRESCPRGYEVLIKAREITISFAHNFSHLNVIEPKKKKKKHSLVRQKFNFELIRFVLT